ncbi:Wzz/FepE/Etk N-terminal domain-containing protein [Marinobacter alexandrii]|uniref:Wzz/FepE/Etk N-terminal domain-containing protein n=1 Tax=Marinobacter alexandrii TaxID=2570351 RepID=UPI001FFFAB43|nr:Wzz/FepE/Etk N-terminal domain-containing protein [Marinobacter alexandrii]MCK2150077.1 Wzz/FepE/Etk N-terminal domain-containing protein [Marinobacter alexandrii]
MTQYEAYNTPQQDDEIDLRELFATIWAGKWLIIAITFVFAVSGVAYALYKPNIYQANVLLAPANKEGGVGGISGQLGGLASLAGINLGSGGSNQAVIAREVLQSRAFLANFIRRHNLEISLMAAEAWNSKSQEWRYNREVYNPETGEWLTDDEGESYKPTDWDLVNAFKERHLSVSENKDSGMIKLSVKSLSPPAAKEWAEWLVMDINEHMRQQDVVKANARINYLEEKLNDTSVAGMQQVFYQLIESETRTVMLANAQQEYVFETVDPAVVPQEKSEPKRAMVAFVATMLGCMLGVFTVFIRASISRGKKENANE